MKVHQSFDLTNFNSYRVHATCARAFLPENEEDFQVIYSTDQHIPKILLGGGYNVILSKPYYEADFVIVGEDFSKIQRTGSNNLIAEAGIDMRQLSEFAQPLGLSGLEVFCDIPGTLGGAVVMNAGASGEEIKSLIEWVRYLDLTTLKIREMSVNDIKFEYRNSFFQRNPNAIVLKAGLRLASGELDAILTKMTSVKTARWAKQPREFPNAGSVFKRPPGYFVGQLIDQLNLKGYAFGGAKISEKHGGFVVNFNGASGADILAVIQHVRERVFKEIGVELEIEQRII